jgi:hypothetical protein
MNYKNIFNNWHPQLLARINNFNVLVDGSYVLHQDSRYTYHYFKSEIVNEFGIGDNQLTGIGSSLIDLQVE